MEGIDVWNKETIDSIDHVVNNNHFSLLVVPLFIMKIYSRLSLPGGDLSRAGLHLCTTPVCLHTADPL